MSTPTLRSSSILALSRLRSGLGNLTWDNLLFWRFRQGTHPLADLEGPEYLPWAPFRESDLATPEEQRAGQSLLVTGAVRDRENGAPVAGAVLDAWQTNPATGDYDWYGYSLRGKFRAADDGNYSIRTVVPSAYVLPDGPARLNWMLLGVPHRIIEMLTGVDIRRMRPPHIHFMVSAPGYRTLTTQIYFDPARELTEHDVVNIARPVRECLHVDIRPSADQGADFVTRFDFPLDRT
jgi:catechol 1,2-dioxygenase